MDGLGMRWRKGARWRAGGALAGLLVACAACEAPLPPPAVPLITRFEVFPNPQHPGKGPFELLAHASGEGLLRFRWEATGGWLSVASASASGAGLLPAFSAWQPPAEPGRYEVTLTVSDGMGTTSRRRARFAVEETFTRILEPRPAQIADVLAAHPAAWAPTSRKIASPAARRNPTEQAPAPFGERN